MRIYRSFSKILIENSCNCSVSCKIIFSNKFDLFWSTTVFLELSKFSKMASRGSSVVEHTHHDPKVKGLSLAATVATGGEKCRKSFKKLIWKVMSTKLVLIAYYKTSYSCSVSLFMKGANYFIGNHLGVRLWECSTKEY